MSNKQYSAEGLDRLYKAVQQHAEEAFMDAVRREYPRMSTAEEADMLNRYHRFQARAEERIVLEFEQSRGKS